MAFRHGITAAAMALTLALAGPGNAENHLAADTVVATVNGTDITLGHMIVLKQRLPAQYQQLPADVLFEGILDQLVQQTLLGESVDELSLGSRIVLENESRSLRAAEEIQRITDSAISEDAVQKAYDAAYANAEPETEYNASHILVATEEEAQALIDELAGGADFATLAQEKSTGPSGPNGGQLGWFGPGAMVAPFEEAVVAMEVGTVSVPVQTQFGWHVIRLNETRLKDAPALDAVRGELSEALRREAIESRVVELTEGASIDRVEAGSIDPNVLNDISIVIE
ncbi:peptidylprolyl isomerase [Silicimonas sp. MF1-12-2]|uniref:peptidylprolyl isomerase n=1 Tax=Silicimonas sp. MF1-12-2 TaxID=3384793 RepID=UPI0039B445A4